MALDRRRFACFNFGRGRFPEQTIAFAKRHWLIRPWGTPPDCGVLDYASDLAASKRIYCSPNDLDEWLDGRPKNWGFNRFGIMLQLFVCFRLALHSRYPERLAKSLEILDHAFAAYFVAESGQWRDPIQTVESIRKTRQQLYRRLKLD